MPNLFRDRGIYFSPDEGGGGGGDDSSNRTITKMRAEIDSAHNEVKDWKNKYEELESKVSALESEKLSTQERLEKENKALTTKNSELSSRMATFDSLEQSNKMLTEFVEGLYTEQLASLPKEKQEDVKSITFTEGNPVQSLSRLVSAVKLIGSGNTGNTQGNVTDPSNNGASSQSNETKYDPKTVTLSHGLKPISDIIAQKNAMTGRGSNQ